MFISTLLSTRSLYRSYKVGPYKRHNLNNRFNIPLLKRMCFLGFVNETNSRWLRCSRLTVELHGLSNIYTKAPIYTKNNKWKQPEVKSTQSLSTLVWVLENKPGNFTLQTLEAKHTHGDETWVHTKGAANSNTLLGKKASLVGESTSHCWSV